MSAYWKDLLREITKSLGRYFSLIIITALGASSVAGILATSIDMRAVADKTFKARNLYDIQIKSTIGFSDDDISDLRGIPGVGVVMPTNSFDVYAYFENEVRTMRAFALPDSMNAVALEEGRLPESASEAAVERAILRHWGLRIGDTVKLGLDNMDDYFSVLKNSEFTITGVVVSPFFIIPYDRGTTSLGDGRLNNYMYLSPDAFDLDVFTDAYILMEESREMDNLSESYFTAAQEWVRMVKQTGNLSVNEKAREFSDAQEEIDEGWREYEDGAAELDDKVADAQKELDDAEIELAEAEAELEDARVKLEEAQATLDAEIADALAEIDRREGELEAGKAGVEANHLEIESGQSELDKARETLLANLQVLESMAYYGASPEINMQYDAIFLAQEQLEQKQAELSAGRAALDEAEEAISEGMEQIRRARATLEQERIDAQTEIDDGWAEYHDGLASYNEGVAEWRDGLETLWREEADALLELADARRELIDAQKTLDDVPSPEWFYFTRSDNQAFESYYQDTRRLDEIGYVFPIVFFIVAVLVSLTTMSRMVDEQRTQIGIYRALGYGTLRIIMRLLLYALGAGVTGGILGVVGGSYLFPRVIYGAYMHMYDMPPIETPIPVEIGIVAGSASVGIVLAATLVSSLRSMRHTPAELMRPKTPPAGKRVLIEKAPFIWGRLKFTSKVTARNIFRYKKRFIMTLVGVAGCTALLLTSFGLRDSLAAIAELQYGKLTTYTSRAYLKEISTDKQRGELDSLMSGDWLYIREESLSAVGSSFSVSMIVPESAERLGEFIEFYSRKTGETFRINSGGILITEKLAREVGVSEGGSFSFTIDGEGPYTVRVDGVVENYVRHHIYMTQELYMVLFGEAPLLNSALSLSSEASAGALLENSAVRAVVHTADLKESTSDSTDALEIVAIVLICLACALAFVVLFNLTNINIIERVRELATIKVLGFYNEELSMYIYRENGLVALMGIALGLVMGIFLHGYVLTAAEIDLLMFPRIILPQSYVYSVALTIVFAVFVNLVMNFKLARIDMVESLKNVE